MNSTKRYWIGVAAIWFSVLLFRPDINWKFFVVYALAAIGILLIRLPWENSNHPR